MKRNTLAAVSAMMMLFAGYHLTAQSISSGSGFIIEQSGYILSNFHVVAGSEQIVAMLCDGSECRVKVIVADQYKDLALLKIDKANVPTVAIGESKGMQVMGHIMVIGFPLVGTVGPEVSMSDGRINAIPEGERVPLFQIDANINPGNSGGPVLNDRGEVIGIAMAKLNAAKLLQESGFVPQRINYAIPIDEARYLIRRVYPLGVPKATRSNMDPTEIYREVRKATVLIFAKSSGESSPNSVPTAPSANRGDTVSQAGLFSYQAPTGWSIKNTDMSKYEVAFDAPRNNFAANINIGVYSNPMSLADYVAWNKQVITTSPMFTHCQILDERPFETSTGAKGVRLVAKDTLGKQDLQQIFYFFEGSSNNKFVVTASCLAGDGDQYAPIFDASLKTFSPQ